LGERSEVGATPVPPVVRAGTRNDVLVLAERESDTNPRPRKRWPAEDPTIGPWSLVTTEGIGRRLVRDTAWYGVSAALAKALALLTVPILTRTLGPGDYGLVDLATSTAGLLPRRQGPACGPSTRLTSSGST